MYSNSTGGLDNGEWGTICDTSWNFQDARVVCHQLGYLDAVVAPMSTHFGKGTGPIWLDDIQCLGTEPDLFTCRHNGITEHICEHGEYASAECLGNYVEILLFLIITILLIAISSNSLLLCDG